MMRIKPNFALWLLTLTLVGGMAAVQASETIKKIEINEASIETLDRELHGIGPKKAKAIVEYREAHGPFKSLDELDEVYGIGPKTIDKNRHRMFIRPPEPENPPEANNSQATPEPVADESEESGEIEALLSEDSSEDSEEEAPTDEEEVSEPDE